jgi:hypothetical protein
MEAIVASSSSTRLPGLPVALSQTVLTIFCASRPAPKEMASVAILTCIDWS